MSVGAGNSIYSSRPCAIGVDLRPRYFQDSLFKTCGAVQQRWLAYGNMVFVDMSFSKSVQHNNNTDGEVIPLMT